MTMNKRLPARRRTGEVEERPGSGARLSPDVKTKIGQNLRVMYAESSIKACRIDS